jgi:hypothetical protein
MALLEQLYSYPGFTTLLSSTQQAAALFSELCALLQCAGCGSSVDLSETGDAPRGTVLEAQMAHARSAVRASFKVSFAKLSSTTQYCTLVHGALTRVMHEGCHCYY